MTCNERRCNGTQAGKYPLSRGMQLETVTCPQVRVNGALQWTDDLSGLSLMLFYSFSNVIFFFLLHGDIHASTLHVLTSPYMTGKTGVWDFSRHGCHSASHCESKQMFGTLRIPGGIDGRAQSGTRQRPTPTGRVAEH